MTPEDRATVESLLAGDAATIRRVREWIVTGLHQFRGSLSEELEDLEQEIVIELLEALDAGRFRGESRLETYVRSQVRFRCIDRLRASGRRTLVAFEDEGLPDARDSALDRMLEREEEALARRVVEAVPEGCRELWTMIGKGLSYKEMGDLLGVAEGAVRVRVHRCRQKALELRKQFSAN